MLSRRSFLKSTPLLAYATLMACQNQMLDPSALPSFTMPEESEPHERTWMAFVANEAIYYRRQLPEIKQNLTLIAKTIAQYEPVSMLVSPQDYDEAVTLLDGLSNHAYPITLHDFTVDDLWLRDTGPSFVKDAQNKKLAVNFNFNGWGNKQRHTRDAQVASFIAETAGSAEFISNLVLEGGCFELDGHGTAIMTKSCIINDNRNPDYTFSEIETELKALLGLRKIIWLDGIAGKDITDGHTDFYARFTSQANVLVSRETYEDSFDYQVTRDNIRALQSATDADGNPLNLTIIDTPETINEFFGVDEFAAGYIGYYVCNDAVILQKFGDDFADNNAFDILAEAFPDRTIEQIAIDGIASGGGSIHCATQQEPKF